MNLRGEIIVAGGMTGSINALVLLAEKHVHSLQLK